ncbi:MAG TPA: homocysteine S-methyltransferase family protein [Melioribacteraceae bacterium]|nr:homocysteine S-methyltransferase family protein [Melioribacteraceae bacterium]
MRKILLQKLKENKLMVSDGGWGTFLMAKGMEVGSCPELWNKNNYDDVFDIAKSYISAGSLIIKTNTFGGSSIKLNDYNIADDCYLLNKLGAEISRKAAGEDNYVMGSIGPTGKFLFTGDVTEEELYNSFKLQAKALIEGGVDAILFETFYAIDEAECAIKSVKDNFDIPIFCTFTFEKGEDGNFRTMMGVDINSFTEQIGKYDINVIGTNCGNGFAEMVTIVKEIKSKNLDIPIMVNSNAGMPEIIDGKLYFPETSEYIKTIIPELINAGANIIGGCCGTTPEHIKVIKKVIEGS